MTDLVRLNVDGGVGVVTLNRPDKRNALNADMIAGLGDAYRTCDADDAVRVVVVTGAGSSFCAGADLSPGKSPFATVADDATFQSSPIRPRAWEVRKPVIAAINGPAIGIGFSLALQTDLRIVATDAILGVVQSRRGVVADAQSHFVLPRLVGIARAAELLVAGRTITGERAATWGLANEAVPAGDVLATAMTWANDIAANVSPLSAAMSKRIMWRSLAATADEVDDDERDAHLILMGRPDAIEGGQAFAQRRSPNWGSKVPQDWPFPQ